MSKIIWKDKYNVGNEKIDSQHQFLVSLINKIDDKKNNEKLDVLELFKDMSSYAEKHFKDEEVLMKKINYRNYTEHQKEHYNFIKKLNELYKKIEQDEEIIDEILFFLSDWLVNHILICDKELANFFETEEEIAIEEINIID